MDARRLTVWSARLVLILAAAFLLTNIAETADAQVFRITVRMSGAQEVPPVATAGTGVGRIVIDTASRVIMGPVTFTGLSSATIPNAGHIHLAPAPGANGPVIIPLRGGGGVMAGRSRVPATVLTAAQMRALRTNRLYLNIHTGNNPGGEIRGNINWGRRIPVASLNEAPMVKLASADIDPMFTGYELTAPSSDGGISVPGDVAARLEMVGDFIRPAKCDLHRDGKDGLGA